MSKSAFLKDNNGNLLQAVVINTSKMISIRIFNTNYELLGYMNMFFQDNNRIFLSEIYCYDEYRSLGIATKISKLADYVLKDYQGYILRGIYHPTQMSSDFQNKYRSKEELDLRARNFYEKNGFKILNYYEYINNRNKYDFLSVNDDFCYNGSLINDIVYKVIKEKDYNYYEDNDVIFFNENNKKK